METTEDGETMDWRARLHSEPRDTRPRSPVVTWLLRILLCLGLFLAGSLFVLLAGAYAGLSRGIGPEQTGGTLYVLLGLILNLAAGAGIATWVAYRSTSRLTPRLVFYSFSAPAFLVVVLLGLLFVENLFR